MIVPSIDIQGGQTVQLIGGREKELDAGDPLAMAERLSVAGEMAVIDLDAACGTGDNRAVIRELVRRYPCRVGGGIRDLDRAREWLDAGAQKVILGTAAEPELLAQLPRERVIAALDANHGEIVVEGWRKPTGRTIEERMSLLAPLVGGFLVTFVEREGRLQGTSLDRAAALVKLAGDARVTIAGGVTTAEEIAALDRLGADAQVGMAIYKGLLDLADAFAAPLVSERPDGLWPTLVCDERGVALGLAWSDAASLRAAFAQRRGVYHSRKRGLWVKGESSGDTQRLVRVDADCDRDALRFTVHQEGAGFCHLGTRTCFGPESGLGALERTLAARRREAPPGSYTQRLFTEPGLLAAKIREEAEELVQAAGRDEIVHEAADLLYFTLARLAAEGVDLAEVEAELDRRALRLTRRRGDAKPAPTGEEPR